MGHQPTSDLNAVIAAMDQSPLLLTFYEGDPLVVTAHNTRAEAVLGPILGLTPEEAFGATPLEELGRRLPDVASTGRSFSADGLQIDVVDEDGRHTLVFLDVVAQPWLRSDGSIRGVATVAVDVTDAVTARRAQDARVAQLRRDWTAARDTLTTIQDAMLPEGLPVLAGSRIAAEYLMAENASGGDWFDAIGLDDGRVVLVVGDVVGHGVGASVVMGELRAVFDEQIRRDGDILAALEVLDHRARRITQARATTLCVALFAPQSGVVTYCTAGHPPPLTIRPGEGASYLPPTGGRPLGSGEPYQLAEHWLEEDDVLILYSNGLVSRPGRTPMRSTMEVVGMADAVHDKEAARPEGDVPLVQRVCSGLVEAASREGFVDDIAVLAAQRVEPQPTLSLSMEAQPEVPKVVRHRLAEWLKPLGVSSIDETALQHSVSELVSNAVEHAYTSEGSADRTVELEACLAAGGVLEIVVTDRGQWREADPTSDRGRGLAMVQGFCDEFQLERGPSGTRARVRHHPRRPAQLLLGSGPPAEPSDLTVNRREGALVLSGSVDAGSADRLRHELALCSRGGTVPVVVDLSGVTSMASIAVQVLDEQMEMRSELRLVAPMGSPAQHVLDVVQLPYSTSLDGVPASPGVA